MTRPAICTFLLFIVGCSFSSNAQDSTRTLKRVVFLGNSITYAGGYLNYTEASILALFPKLEAEFINLGVPSETVSGLSEPGHADGKFPRPDLHERLARVLAATKPDIVFACYGMNDGIYLPFDDKRFAAFRNGIEWLHTMVEKSGAKIVHLTPPVYDETKNPGVKYAHTLKRYTDWLLAQQKQQDWIVIDLHNPMLQHLQAKRKTDPAYALAKDGVHPAGTGHWLMARQVLAGLGQREALAAGSFEDLLRDVKQSKQILQLVKQRQELIRDAWLRETKHLRPGLAEGLPMQTAIDSAKVLTRQLNNILPPVLIEVRPSAKKTVIQKYGSYTSLNDAIQKALAQADRNVVIRLKPGVHFPDTTIVISSDAYHLKSLTIQGDSNQATVISGAQTINPVWKPYRKGILMADIRINPVPDQLFAGDKALPMARFPNFDSNARVFNGISADAVSAAKVRSWKNPVGAYLHALHQGEWGGFHYRVTGKNPDGELALEGGWQNNRPSPLHKTARFIENVFEELDAPGEWYYDSLAGKLFYYPLAGEDPRKTIFSISRLTNLLVVRGDSSSPVRNITIKNLQFTGTNRSFMLTREPLLRSDWTIYRGGAILLEGTENISINRCEFYSLGGNAIFLSNYNRNDTISTNHIHDIGANAISFVGNSSAVRSPAFNYNEAVNWQTMDMLQGPKTSDYPSACVATDNLVHHIGTIEKQVAGVQISMSADIVVQHNTIYNLPRAGINIGDGCWGGHIIEYNDVFNTVLETGDHGAFNSWGRDRFWSPDRNRIDSLVAARPGVELLDVQRPITIRNNRFQCDHGWDIDLDDGSSNYEIYNNICLSGGLKLREGYRRTVRNNIIINNSFHPHVWLKNSDDVLTYNVVTTSYAPIQISYWGKKVDHNFFMDSISLAAAQQMGIDSNGMAGVTNFVNPLQGDFRVHEKSVLLKNGFVNFPMKFGVTDPRLKKTAARPVFKPLLSQQAISGTKIVEWLGASIKNISTLGEQSAAGLPDRHGALVTSTRQGTATSNSGLVKGDVIRKLGAKTISDAADLLQAYETVKWMGEAECIIIRNQSEQKLMIRFK